MVETRRIGAMMPHALGSALIPFGLVSIPVRLYTAAASAGVAFHLLHATCGHRIRQQLVCPVEHAVVERGELVKGYEVAKDQYDLTRCPSGSPSRRAHPTRRTRAA
jgi:non-homologous end joining protein Ku